MIIFQVNLVEWHSYIYNPHSLIHPFFLVNDTELAADATKPVSNGRVS